MDEVIEVAAWLFFSITYFSAKLVVDSIRKCIKAPSQFLFPLATLGQGTFETSHSICHFKQKWGFSKLENKGATFLKPAEIFSYDAQNF